MKTNDLKTDAELKADVIEALKWEPSIEVEEIEVAARHGIVTLMGSVPYFAAKGSAERATRRVQGVKGIADELDVRRVGVHNRRDPDIAEAAVNVLAWHVWVPDTVLATVDNGWVTLTGHVAWEYERNAAEQAVKYLSGVTGVDNEIEIRPTVEPRAVKAAIETALRRDAQIDAENIEVLSKGSKITLSGTTHSWSERDEAESAAWSAPGVTAVQNDLAVAA